MSNCSPIEYWDVVVVGAGPAGATAAICAARQGLCVLLVDAKRFPRRKVCGGCLNRVSVGLLTQLLGPEHPLWSSAIPLDLFLLAHRHRHFSFAMPAGMAIDRAVLDESLVETAQQAGVTFRSSVTAKLLSTDSHSRGVELTQAGLSSIVQAKAVVLAGGLGFRVADSEEIRHNVKPASRVGIEAIFERFPEQYSTGAIHMAVARHGYVGLTRISNQRLHVAAAVDRAELQRLGPAGLSQAILHESGSLPLQEDKSAHWRGTPALTARAERLAGERVFLVGDAASYVEPFTGEGIRWALETGMGVTPLVVQSQAGWRPSLIDAWESWYRRQIEPEQRLCRRIASGLKQPLVRWFAHQVLRVQPRFASALIARLNQES